MSPSCSEFDTGAEATAQQFAVADEQAAARVFCDQRGYHSMVHDVTTANTGMESSRTPHSSSPSSALYCAAVQMEDGDLHSVLSSDVLPTCDPWIEQHNRHAEEAYGNYASRSIPQPTEDWMLQHNNDAGEYYGKYGSRHALQHSDARLQIKAGGGFDRPEKAPVGDAEIDAQIGIFVHNDAVERTGGSSNVQWTTVHNLRSLLFYKPG